MSEDQPKRYVPPHKRNGASSQQNQQKRQQQPSYPRRHVQYRPTPCQNEYNFDGQEFKVTLKTSKSYEKEDLPAEDFEQIQAESGRKSYNFQVAFEEDKIRDLMRWFRNVGRTDHESVLEFPPTLDKVHRKELHQLADNFGLATSSQGFGEKRFLTVYTEATATVADNTLPLTKEENRKSQEVWFLVRKIGGSYSKYSHNEINEMIIANKLHPALQELLDKNQDVLAQEFQLKCNVSEDANWRDQCKMK